MTADASHPTPAQLRAFGNGGLDDEDARAVAAHLETCTSCRRGVEGLTTESLHDANPSDRRPETVGRPADALPAALTDHPRYRVERELGRGGMGVVYAAHHLMMDRRVALKLINRAVLDHPDALARFHAEVRNAAKLAHPNIVVAHDAEQAGDLHMLVMEFVEGDDLAKVLAKRGPLPIPNACDCARQAALGLQHAFEKGMVHRDVKPQNLMLTPQGQVKVLDFGLARVTEECGQGGGLTRDGAFMGTPEYVSPEQATDARTADIRADIYSLGCTLYALLAGRPPFREGAAMKTVLAQREKEPPPLPSLRPEVSAELWSVVAKMLAKNPEKRYQTPEAVARALAPFATASAAPRRGDPVAKPGVTAVEAPSEGRTEAAPREAGANPGRGRFNKTRLRIALGAAGVFAILAGVVLALTFAKSDDSRADAEKKPSAAPPDDPPAADRVVTNSLGMKFVLIPARTFLMGSPPNEVGRRDDEEQHEVEITKPFYLGAYQVTQEEYETAVGSNPSFFSATGAGKDLVAGLDTRRFPVDSVTWHEAVAFCRKLSEMPEEKRAGRVYRLPTEAEWECACRGGESGSAPFFFKSPSPSASSRQANFNGSNPYGGAAEGPNLGRTTAVGSYEANAFGLFDMHGNVWQWCADSYGAYPRGAVKNYQGPETGGDRVVRGASWRSNGEHCRAACRGRSAPSVHYFNYGCRVAFAAPTSP